MGLDFEGLDGALHVPSVVVDKEQQQKADREAKSQPPTETQVPTETALPAEPKLRTMPGAEARPRLPPMDAPPEQRLRPGAPLLRLWSDEEAEALPTIPRTVPPVRARWSEVPTLAAEDAQMMSPLRLALAIGVAALVLLLVPLAIYRSTELSQPRPAAVHVASLDTPVAAATAASGSAAAPAVTVHAPGASASATAGQPAALPVRPVPTVAQKPGTGGLRAVAAAGIVITTQPARETTLPGALFTSPLMTSTRAAMLRPGDAAPPVQFSFGSAVPELIDDAVLAAANRCPGALLVTGHSCWLGGPDVQQAFGLARAGAVRDWLIGHGVTAARIRVASAGSRQPVASNSTRSGRRANRRVTMTCSTGGDL